MSIIHTVQKAIYQQLNGDSGVTALVSGIYDFVPDDVAAPYIVIGEATQRRVSLLHDDVYEVVVAVDIYSGNHSSKLCNDVIAAVQQSLEDALDLAPYSLVSIYMQKAEIAPDAALQHYNAALQYKIIME